MITRITEPGVVLAPGAPRPIRWPVVPRAAWTTWHGGVYAFYRHLRGSVVGWVLTLAYVALFVLAAVKLNLTWLAALVLAAGAVTGIAVFALICCVLIEAQPLLPVFRRRKRGYTDQAGTLVVTATRKDGGRTWRGSNLAAWPRGQQRALAFIDDLTALAVAEGAVLEGKAGSRELLDKLYRGAGFTAISEGRRPKIRRAPTDPGPGER